ncbi:NAD(P)-binding protein [Rhizodiscina lignyota]|uniref:NAD(P)-binding protein n=1 Tax=Rhizodiscina lignyota TaxID=1504668 RepID=A0A9P4I8U8_9PEZI|nr:NAD(P)-binding protein [Rhizodiscina lignyota]
MRNELSQFVPPAPRFTEKDVSDQEGRVFLVTGASSGVGKQLAKLLYGLNATIYLASRTESRAITAIDEIRAAHPSSRGALHFLEIDLEDFASVARAAKQFLQREERLDILFNNAGTMMPPEDAKTKQGYDLQLGSNAMAPLLFTQLLTPILAKTAKLREPGGVRVIWVSSSAAELATPKNGIDLNNLDFKKPVPNATKYGVSKAAMLLLALEYAKREKNNGIVTVPLNPGNLKTDLRRHVNWLLSTIFDWMSHDPIKGAYTELFGGFSADITLENSGCWVIPWGRFGPLRQDLADAAKSPSEGGTGIGAKLWEWCEEQIRPYKTA